MSHLLLFAAGFIAGATVLFWFLSRPVPSVNQRLEEEWRVPITDPYTDGIPW